jgi:hypothetical protein
MMDKKWLPTNIKDYQKIEQIVYRKYPSLDEDTPGWTTLMVKEGIKSTVKEIYHRLNQAQTDKELRQLMDSLGKELLLRRLIDSGLREIEKS